jgi:hypothetical protein
MLQALQQELLEASDEEIIQAANDLGMNPEMKGSAAFAGLKYPATPQLSDFFEFEVCRKLQVEAQRITAARTPSKRKARDSRRTGISRDRKESGDN